MIRVLIADDHAVVREGIRHVLSADDGIEVVGEAANGREAVALAQSLAPDVVVLDLTMPVLSGLDAASEIREHAPGVRILVLSIHDHEEYVLQSVRAGAQGYLRKDSSPAELRGAIRSLSAGGTVFSAPVARTLAAAVQGERETQDKRRRIDSLTARERDVLIGIAGGSTNRDIATQLGLSVRTVESHREAMMRKLGVRGVAALTKFALDAGVLSARQGGGGGSGSQS
ncbi:MAG TPA: response regulator transcription factor [Gemmatimonadaceae bacterium]|nr:response regulator transcription factor [Gemmatimonadaceae bacterium]